MIHTFYEDKVMHGCIKNIDRNYLERNIFLCRGETNQEQLGNQCWILMSLACSTWNTMKKKTKPPAELDNWRNFVATLYTARMPEGILELWSLTFKDIGGGMGYQCCLTQNMMMFTFIVISPLNFFYLFHINLCQF